jgi:hypothetical protein
MGYNQCWSINEFWLVLGSSQLDLRFSQGEPSGITKGNNWFQNQTNSSHLGLLKEIGESGYSTREPEFDSQLSS